MPNYVDSSLSAATRRRVGGTPQTNGGSIAELFAIVGPVIALTVAGLAMGVFSGEAPSPDIAFLFVCACAVSIAGLLGARAIVGFHVVEVFPWFLPMSFLYIVVRPLVLLAIASDKSTDVIGYAGLNTSTGTMVLGTYWATMGLCAFSFAYRLSLASRLGARWARGQVPPVASAASAHILVAILLLVGLVGRAYLISIKGGIFSFQDTRGLDNAGLGPVWFGAGLTVSVTVFYVWGVLTGYLKRAVWLDALVVLGIPSILFINSRGGFLIFALAFLFLIWSRGHRRLFVPLAIAAMVTVLSWGSIRGYLGTGSPDLSLVPDLSDSAAIEKYTTSSLSLGVTDMYWLVVAETPGTAEYQHGAIFLGSILELIPRAIWPNKPLTGSNYFMQVFFQEQTGQNSLGPGFFGVLYLEWGPFAIVAGCLIFGLLSRALFVAATWSKNATWASLAYALVFPITPAMMQGGLYVAIFGPLVSALPMIFIIMAVGRRNRVRRAGSVAGRRLVGRGDVV